MVKMFHDPQQCLKFCMYQEKIYLKKKTTFLKTALD